MKKLFLIISLLIPLKSHSYQLFRSGNAKDVSTHIHSYYCLAGGGSDDNWQDGWNEMLKNINGGDILIIREDKKRGRYEDWLLKNKKSGLFSHFNSVTTLSLDKFADSFNPKVLELVKKSELIFFAGGFQNNYFDYIKNTPLQHLIQTRVNNRSLVLGGTSAGAAIMPGLAFGAHYTSPSSADGFLSSKDVLENPLRDEIDLINGLFQIPYMKNFVLDTHFSRRHRQGRLMGFMANGLFKNNVVYNGIGIGEDTAFCFDSKGKGKFFGTNDVYFLTPVHTPHLNVDHSLSWDQLHVKKFSAGDVIDLKVPGAFFGEEVWSSDHFIAETLWQ